MFTLFLKFLSKNRIPFKGVHLGILFAVLVLSSVLLAKPMIVGPKLYGVYPNTPFLFPLGVLKIEGEKTFTALSTLPSGLELDSKTGFITGTAPAKGKYEFKFKANDSNGEDTSTLVIYSGDTLGYLPPMAWSSWNFWNRCVDQHVILETANFIATSGLRDLGFHYVNIDDAWCQRNRNSNDDMVVRSSFSMGIKAITDSIHKLGLKVGLYSDVGSGTFEGGAGSRGYYEHDAKMFAKWGVDYLKVDNAGGGSNERTVSGLYKSFGKELKNSGRTIMLSVCEWGRLRPWIWAREAYASLWRTTWDSRDYWWARNYTNGSNGLINGYDVTHKSDTLFKFAGHGGWNDMDMMWICMRTEMDHGQNPPKPKLYPAKTLSKFESQTMMSIWSLFASPLILGNDFTKRWSNPAPDTLMNILLHEEIIAINQDVLGIPARIISDQGDLETFTRPLAGNSMAVGLLNRGTSTGSMKFKYDQLNLSPADTFIIRDVWERKNVDTVTGQWEYSCNVKTHQVEVFKISKLEAMTPIINGSANNINSRNFSYNIGHSKQLITIASNENLNKIEVINLNGKTISSFNISGRKTFSFNKSHLIPGLYLLKLVANQKVITSKVLINN